MFRAEESGNGFLFDVRVFLFESVREAECYDGKTGVVVGAAFGFFAERDVFGITHYVLTLWTVDVADAGIPACCFERFAKETGVGQAVLHDVSEAFEAQMDQVVVLGYNLSAGAGEVERVGFFGAA